MSNELEWNNRGGRSGAGAGGHLGGAGRGRSTFQGLPTPEWHPRTNGICWCPRLDMEWKEGRKQG